MFSLQLGIHKKSIMTKKHLRTSVQVFPPFPAANLFQWKKSTRILTGGSFVFLLFQGSIANLRGQWKLLQMNLGYVGAPFSECTKTPPQKKRLPWSPVDVTVTNHPETDRPCKVHSAIVQHCHRAEDGQEQGDCCNTIPWTVMACNTRPVWIPELMDLVWIWLFDYLRNPNNYIAVLTVSWVAQ